MSNRRICPVCGNATYHFNEERGLLVCDVCRTEMRTEAEQNEELTFRRNMALAKQHLRVANWEEAKRLVRPYMNSRPNEKNVYLYMLVATTKCFEDLLVNDKRTAEEAMGYWDKLEKLGCVTTAMKEYKVRRAEKVKAAENADSAETAFVTGIQIVISFLTLGLMAAGNKVSILLLIPAITGWVHISHWLEQKERRKR